MVTIDPKSSHEINFNNVYKAFHKKVILNNISFTVDEKEILAVIGPSGTGKSTILKLICGLIEPDKGEVTLNSNKMSMAFQFSALLNFLTVKENIALPLRKNTSMNEKEISERVAEVLDMVGLVDTGNLFPSELSGGMQKRVGFARAIVTNPDIILYDEPTSGLDPMTTNMIVQDILHLRRMRPVANVIVTHDLHVLEEAADKVILLYKGDIAFMGTAKEFRDCKNEYARQFYHGKCEGPMLVCSHH